MSTSRALTLVVIAFASGFLLNEKLHRQAKSQGLLSAMPANHFIEDDKMKNMHQAEETDRNIKSIENAEPSVAVAQSVDVNNSKVFSWELVNQLIENARYDEAIHLLQSQLSNSKNSTQAWNVIAQIYKKKAQPIAAMDAWFRYLKQEPNAKKIDQTLKDIKNYLAQLKEIPSQFNEDYSWLISQYDELLKYTADDGELHLIMASLYLKLNDNYQSQYHALMAVNDPRVKKQAEDVLAKLNGEKLTEDINIPLAISGNQYVVNANIEGYPVRLLLDTGASLSGLSSNYTAQYPFMLKDTKPIRLNTASGTQNSFLFTVNNLSIGSLVFNQHILAQLPMSNSGNFDGLLGVDILGRFDFVIDQDASMLRLKARKK